MHLTLHLSGEGSEIIVTLWLRMILVIIRSWRSGPATLSEERTLKFRVWLTEADLSLFNNARYFSMMELGRLDIMLRTGAFRWARKNRLLPLVAAQTIRYKRSLKRFQTFTLKSRVICWDAKYIYIEHNFFRKGRLMAAGLAKACFLGKEGVASTEKFLQDNGLSLMSPPIPEMIIKWQESETAMMKGFGDREAK